MIPGTYQGMKYPTYVLEVHAYPNGPYTLLGMVFHMKSQRSKVGTLCWVWFFTHEIPTVLTPSTTTAGIPPTRIDYLIVSYRGYSRFHTNKWVCQVAGKCVALFHAVRHLDFCGGSCRRHIFISYVHVRYTRMYIPQGGQFGEDSALGEVKCGAASWCVPSGRQVVHTTNIL